MKKKICWIAMALTVSLALSLTASAYYADVVATHGISRKGMVGFSTITANTDWGLNEMMAQVQIYDLDLETYGFNTQTLVKPTVDTLKVFKASDPLTVGKEYFVQAFGKITYPVGIGVEEEQSYHDEDYFVYKEYGTRSVVEEAEIEEKLAVSRAYSLERADYLFRQFGMNPDDYLVLHTLEIYDYVKVEPAAFMYASLVGRGIVTTAATFFADTDFSVIYGVCQDEDAVNRLYEFRPAEDGDWTLAHEETMQDSGRYADVVESLDTFKARTCSG